jgi:ribosomal protein L37AE/L43A
VKKNPAAHDCTSRRRAKKVKNATKLWLCEKVKDWLIEDATLGAKELQKMITRSRFITKEFTWVNNLH